MFESDYYTIYGGDTYQQGGITYNKTLNNLFSKTTKSGGSLVSKPLYESNESKECKKSNISDKDQCVKHLTEISQILLKDNFKNTPEPFKKFIESLKKLETKLITEQLDDTEINKLRYQISEVLSNLKDNSNYSKSTNSIDKLANFLKSNDIDTESIADNREESIIELAKQRELDKVKSLAEQATQQAEKATNKAEAANTAQMETKTTKVKLEQVLDNIKILFYALLNILN